MAFYITWYCIKYTRYVYFKPTNGISNFIFATTKKVNVKNLSDNVWYVESKVKALWIVISKILKVNFPMKKDQIDKV